MENRKQLVAGSKAVMVAALLFGSMVALTFGGSEVFASSDCDLEIPDDHSTIQAAIDAAGEGDKICVEAGTYEEEVVIGTNGIELVAADGAEPVLDGSSDLEVGIHVDGADEVRIEGFKIKDYDREGIRVSGSEDVVLEDNEVVSNGHSENYPGISVTDGSDRVVVRENLIDDSRGSGLYVEESQHPSVEDNVMTNNFLRGIEITGTEGSPIEGIVVKGNEISDNRLIGLWILWAEAALIEDNEIKDNVNFGNNGGFRLQNAPNSEVLENTISGHSAFSGTQYGVLVFNSDHVLIKDNHIERNSDYGVWAVGSEGPIVEWNTVRAHRSSDGAGIHITDGPDAKVENNTVDDNGNNGISITNSDEVVVANNTVEDSDRSAIAVGGAAPVVKDNTVQASGLDSQFSTAVSIAGDGSTGARIERNEVTDSSLGGISVSGAPEALVSENIVEDSDRRGLRVSNSPAVEFRDNKASGNGEFGFEFRDSDDALIKNNEAQGHPVDLYLEDSTGAQVQDNTFQAGVFMEGEEIDHFTHEFSGNTVQGGSLFYALNQAEAEVPSDAAQVFLVNAPATDVLDMAFMDVAVGVQVAFSDDVVLRNVEVEQGVLGLGPWMGTTVVGSSNVLLDQIEVSDARDDGIFLIEAPSTTIEDSKILRSSGVGVYVEDSPDLVLDGNTIKENEDSGLRIQLESPNPVLIGNEFIDNGDRGAWIRFDSPGGVFEQSIFTGNDGTGLQVQSADARVVDNQFVNNNRGAVISNAGDVVVRDNNVKGGSRGISVSGGSDQTVVEDNIIQETSFRGLEVGSSGGMVKQNTVSGSGSTGITITGGPGTIVEKNTVLGNDGEGIDIRVEDAVVTRNTVEGSSEEGIFLTIASGSMVDNNTVTGSDRAGIFLRNSDGVTVENNTIMANDKGIHFFWDTDDIVVQFNRIKDNEGPGIQVDIEMDLRVRDNTISDNGDGLVYGVSDPVEDLDATDNFWGDPSGPGGEGPGSGDTVSEHVLFDPWLTNNPTPSYFDMVIDSTNAPVVAGEILEVEVTVENLGGETGTQLITLENVDGEIVHSEPLELDGDTSESLVLEWETPIGESSHGEIIVATEDVSRTTMVWVLLESMPGVCTSDSGVLVSTVDESIQSVIDAAETGDTVCVLPGTYEQGVEIENDVSLIAASDHDPPVLDGGGEVRRGVYADRQTGVLVEGLVLKDYTDYAIYVESVETFVIRGNTITDSEVGINVYDALDVRVEDNTVSGSDEGAIIIDWVDEVEVTGNHAFDNTHAGLEVMDWGDLTVQDNVFVDNDVGFLLDRGRFGESEVVVENNVFDNNADYGVFVDRADSDEILMIQIKHNRIQGNGEGLVNDAGVGDLDAQDNWWGDASGPSGEGDGVGDSVSPLVSFSPWLESDPIGDPPEPSPAFFEVTIESADSPVVEGQALDVEVLVENTGDEEGTRLIELKDFDGEMVNEEEVTLSGGDSTSITLTWSTTTGDAGTDTITVTSGNNEDTVLVEIVVPDDMFFDVKIDGTNAPITEGQDLVVTLSVTNLGEQTDTQTIELLDDVDVVVDEEPVTLGGNEGDTIALVWSTGPGDRGLRDITVRSVDDSDSMTVFIDAPEAVFSWDPVIPAPGDQVEFDAGGSSAPEGEIEWYRWDFTDDGVFDEVTQDATITHTFAEPGSYSVLLEVEDDTGATDSLERTVHVQESGDPIWIVELEDPVGVASPTVVDGVVYMVDGSPPRVLAFSDAGAPLWSFELNEGTSDSPSVVGGTVYVAGGDVYALDADEEGKLVWSTDLGRDALYTTVQGDTVYVTTGPDAFAHNGRIYALDAETGEVQWSDEILSRVTPPTVADGMVFVSDRLEVNAWDAITGDHAWSFPAPSQISGSAPTYSDGVVYVGLEEFQLDGPQEEWETHGYVYAIDAQTGTEIWRHHTDSIGTVVNVQTGETHMRSAIQSSPTVHDGSLYIGGLNLHALDITGGTPDAKWVFETSQRVDSSPSVVGDTVVVGAQDDHTYGVHADDGSLTWVYDAEGDVASSPTVVDGVVFIGSDHRETVGGITHHSGRLHAINAEAGGSSEDSRVLLGTFGHHDLLATFFQVTIDSTNAPVEIPSVMEVVVRIENLGEEDDHTVELLNITGDVVDSVHLTLEPGEVQFTTLTWDVSGEDPGFGEILVRSPHSRDSAIVAVQELRELDECTEVTSPSRIELQNTLVATETCIKITSSGVTVDGGGHTIIRSGPVPPASFAVHVDGGEDGIEQVVVQDLVLDNWKGFEVNKGAMLWENAHGGEISDILVERSYWALLMRFSEDNVISNNHFVGGSYSWFGVHLFNSHKNVIEDNVLPESYYSLMLSSSDDNVITGNEVSGNFFAFSLLGSSGNNLVDNTALRNKGHFGDLGDYFSRDGALDNSVSGLRLGHPTGPKIVASYESANVQIGTLDESPAPHPSGMNLGQYIYVESASWLGEDAWIDAQFEVQYEDDDVDVVDASTLAFWRYDGHEWVLVDSSVLDEGAKTISAEIDEFGTYGVFAEPEFDRIEIEVDGETTLSPGDELTLTANAFDGETEVGSVPVIWETTGDLDPLEETTGTQVVFEPSTHATQGTITANVQAIGIEAQTGGIFVVPDVEQQQWVSSLNADGPVESSAAVDEGRDLLFVGHQDGKVFAVDLESGDVEWDFQTGGPVVSSPFVVDGVVYVGSKDNKIYALDADDGTELWNLETGGPVVSSPFVVNDVVYVGSNDDHVYALDAEDDGNELWSVETGGPVESSPVVVDNVLYVGSNDTMVYALDVSDEGAELWTHETEGKVTSSPAVADGVLYVGSKGGHLYALDVDSDVDPGDRVLWTHETGNGVVSSPLVHEGTVFFGGLDGSVYALDVEDASVVWEHETAGAVHSSPVLQEGVIADIVYIGSDDGHIYGFNAETGEVMLAFDTGDPVRTKPVIGSVFAGNDAGELVGLFGADVAYVVIRDAPGGEGKRLGNLELQAGQSVQLFAAAYNADDEYLGELEALWGWDGEGATLDPVGEPSDFAVLTVDDELHQILFEGTISTDNNPGGNVIHDQISVSIDGGEASLPMTLDGSAPDRVSGGGGGGGSGVLETYHGFLMGRFTESLGPEDARVEFEAGFPLHSVDLSLEADATLTVEIMDPEGFPGLPQGHEATFFGFDLVIESGGPVSGAAEVWIPAEEAADWPRDRLVMMHHDDEGWQALPTAIARDDSDGLVVSFVLPPSFSPFVLATGSAGVPVGEPDPGADSDPVSDPVSDTVSDADSGASLEPEPGEGDEGDTPGPGVVLVLLALFVFVAIRAARRQRSG